MQGVHSTGHLQYPIQELAIRDATLIAALCMHCALSVLYAASVAAIIICANSTIALFYQGDMAQKCIQRLDFMAWFCQVN